MLEDCPKYTIRYHQPIKCHFQWNLASQELDSMKSAPWLHCDTMWNEGPPVLFLGRAVGSATEGLHLILIPESLSTQPALQPTPA